jgi:hypothetical protein
MTDVILWCGGLLAVVLVVLLLVADAATILRLVCYFGGAPVPPLRRAMALIAVTGAVTWVAWSILGWITWGIFGQWAEWGDSPNLIIFLVLAFPVGVVISAGFFVGSLGVPFKKGLLVALVEFLAIAAVLLFFGGIFYLVITVMGIH